MTDAPITHEQVKAVLTVLGEDALLDLPIAWDKNGVGFFEYTELSARLILAPAEWITDIMDAVNNR
jgi:hypothetical protein